MWTSDLAAAAALFFFCAVVLVMTWLIMGHGY